MEFICFFLKAGENVDELDQLFDDIEERWGLLDQLYKKATIRVNEQAAKSKIASSSTSGVEETPSIEKPSQSTFSLHALC